MHFLLSNKLVPSRNPGKRDVGALKQEIFKTIRNEGKMAPEYVERVRRFFIYDDFDHCRRIYEEIVKM
ncbi:MAG: hypothetical protein HFH75_11310 [Lachnospiraceae bacterium]|nr:hypothetical protein [Lachnospiraceae bacterium]